MLIIETFFKISFLTGSYLCMEIYTEACGRGSFTFFSVVLVILVLNSSVTIVIVKSVN